MNENQEGKFAILNKQTRTHWDAICGILDRLKKMEKEIDELKNKI